MLFVEDLLDFTYARMHGQLKTDGRGLQSVRRFGGHTFERGEDIQNLRRANRGQVAGLCQNLRALFTGIELDEVPGRVLVV